MGDPRTVVADPEARYFGAVLEEDSLVPENAVHRARSVSTTGRLNPPTRSAIESDAGGGTRRCELYPTLPS